MPELSDPARLGAILIASYLAGSVPFGWLMARALRGVDIRTTGSGNIGATNAMRALGRPLGMVALLADIAKGFAPVWFLAGGEPGLQVACGAAAVGGHVWPVFLRFRGGKAVATGCGVLLAIDWPIVVGAGLVWCVTLFLWRFVGVASVTMGVAFPCIALARGAAVEVVCGAAALALLIVGRHRSNMANVLAGTEPRVGLFGGSRSRSVAEGESPPAREEDDD
ncbi:MAG: glycerol-3-phosphate 1-O-acyltransferase PlsY [Planctomycetota bacterium]|jgi:glycerol-3-phosphate acyltransferase PlsY|nr:glycerol-3-phosphate 1-O-acyltransferase PlsY [Planctomycetota bacterium]MDP6763484.1 glycerol-3-phosphate 1-O-acyltransferase PlsY [Planctomycetota bacterium]MDP6990852.1 glycerol-3-phosphate 1-O-acyltransferase PlsY [Planctomycetota bacterium]